MVDVRASRLAPVLPVTLHVYKGHGYAWWYYATPHTTPPGDPCARRWCEPTPEALTRIQQFQTLNFSPTARLCYR